MRGMPQKRGELDNSVSCSEFSIEGGRGYLCPETVVSHGSVMLVPCDVLACASVVDRVLFAGILLFVWVGFLYFAAVLCLFCTYCEVPFPRLPRLSENLLLANRFRPSCWSSSVPSAVQGGWVSVVFIKALTVRTLTSFPDIIIGVRTMSVLYTLFAYNIIFCIQTEYPNQFTHACVCMCVCGWVCVSVCVCVCVCVYVPSILHYQGCCLLWWHSDHGSYIPWANVHSKGIQ